MDPIEMVPPNLVPVVRRLKSLGYTEVSVGFSRESNEVEVHNPTTDQSVYLKF